MQRVAEQEILREERIESKTGSRIRNQINDRLMLGKKIPNQLLEDAFKFGVIRFDEKGKLDLGNIPDNLFKRYLTPKQRLYLRLKKKNRMKVLNKFPKGAQ